MGQDSRGRGEAWGMAHRSRVSGFRSSNTAWTTRLVNSSPSTLWPFQVRPLYVGSPLTKNCSPRIETSVWRAGGSAANRAPSATTTIGERTRFMGFCPDESGRWPWGTRPRPGRPQSI